ncbi:hypothetical protein KFE25_008700 [Diacronema lutheri]|uniref:t-SNARE coiled-coil homology domain-containing protein n=2 Tax=Diacronema lutheri TaxID=2081491 RepID=A0A8J5XTK4_DIALT|nr:hypothetical protein KFE25_008700 [Diacronema lutheri]
MFGVGASMFGGGGQPSTRGYAEMLEDISSYEADLVSVEKDIRTSFDAVHHLEGDARGEKLRHIASRLYHAKQLLQTLRLEVVETPTESRAEWQAIVAQHAASLHRYDNLLGALQNDGRWQDMLGGRTADADTLTPAQLIQQAAQVQVQSVESLGRSKQMVHNAREVGTFTADQLRRQTEQMQHVDSDIKDMRFHFAAATRQIQNVRRQVETDKCLAAMLLFIVLGIVVIIVYKTFNPNSKLNTPKGLQPPIGYA